MTAGSEFLAWADHARGRALSINSIALAESTLEFARLFVYQVLPRCDPKPTDWAIAGGMADLLEDGEAETLAGGTPEQAFFSTAQPAPTQGFLFGPIKHHRETPPGVVAFDVLKRIYREFGLPDSAIPFVRDGAVDEELVKAIG